MEKKFFFRWALFWLLNSFNLYAQNITYPVDGSVFQQDGLEKATINFTFSQVNTDNGTIFYRIKNISTQTETVVNGKNRVVLNSPNFINGGGLKGHYAEEVLNKGWYRLEVYREWRFWFFGWKTVTRLTDKKDFGVGDVYFVVGQSNASGYTGPEDNVVAYSTDDNNNQSENKMVRAYQFGEDIGATVFNKPGFTQRPLTRGLPFKRRFDINGLVVEGFEHLKKDNKPIYPSGAASWAWSPLGNKLANLDNTPTLFFNVAHPNTSIIKDWLDNSDFPTGTRNIKDSPTTLIGKFYQTLGFYGNIMGAKSVLWHQGERDSQIRWGAEGADGYLLIDNNYRNYLGELIHYSRSSITGLTNVPWFVSKVSYTSIGNSGGPCWQFADEGHRSTIFMEQLYPYQKANNLPSPINSNILSNVFTGVTSDFITPSNQNGSSQEGDIPNYSSTQTACIRALKQRIHFTGVSVINTTNSLGFLANSWYDAIKSNYTNATGVSATKFLKLMSVAKDEATGKFTFSVESPPSVAVDYYWCINDAGINNFTSKTIVSTSPPITLNVGDRVICYVKDNTGKFYISQPYIRESCTNCRNGSNIFSISPNSLNFSINGETKSIVFDGAFNDWDLQNVPSWITDISWDDDNQKLNITAAPGQNLGGFIEFVESGTTNILARLSITQSATSGCTQTNLSSLTPSSETFSYTGKRNNLNISGQTMMVGGYTSNNGIGVHANSTLVYPLNGQYNTFSGSVGRDDASDNCGCGTMKVQFVIKADGATLFTSNLLGTADGRQAFSVNVAGKNQIELIVNDGGDNTWGDHADWLDAILYCGTPPTCTTAPPIPTNVISSPQTINSGGSSNLSATCATGVVVWNNGVTANSITVSPTVTTSYNAKCVSGSCPASNTVSVGVTVNSGACSGISNNLVMGTWNVNGQQLVARFFNGQYWLTQRAGTNPDVFVVRGSGMLQRSDVSLTNGSYYNMVNCFAWTYSAYDNLQNPPTSTFPTPSGYSLSYSQDGTMIYTANSGGGGGTGCTDAYVSNNWASATIGDGTGPKIGQNYQGGTMNINGTTYSQGIGTHAGSEIVYNLGSHSYANFKASVGRDVSSYNCNCGGQTIVFKVYNHSTGALIGSSTNNPVTKTINQSASDMVVPIAGVSSIRLVVEDGGDQIWGDWANWGKARFTCAGSNFREAPAQTEEWFWVSPNPNDGKFIAKVNLKTPQSVQLYLSDIKGNIIKEYSFVGVEGMNNFEINIQDKITIESIYNIRCQAGEASDSKRVIIEK